MSADLTVAVAGGGRLGFRTAQLLHDRGHKVVIVERDHGRCKQLNDAWIGTVIEGDASRPDVLTQVDPDRCDTLAAMTGDPATNAGICLAADRMTDVHTVMRVDDADAVEAYEGVADRVLYPTDTAARTVANELVGGGVRSVEAVTADLEILEIEVAENAPVAGKRLESVGFPEGTLIIADADGGHVSGAETVLDAGNRYLVATEAGVKREVLNLLRG